MSVVQENDLSYCFPQIFDLHLEKLEEAIFCLN